VRLPIECKALKYDMVVMALLCMALRINMASLLMLLCRVLTFEIWWWCAKHLGYMPYLAIVIGLQLMLAVAVMQELGEQWMACRFFLNCWLWHKATSAM